MAEIGRGSRSFIGTVLVVNFVVYIILVATAGWSLDKYIDGEQDHPHLGGNPATTYMLTFALLGGAIGLCSVATGLIHHRAWRSDSLAMASSTAIISCAITVLAFGLVCKEIAMGGRRGKRLQTLEAFIGISTLSQLIYLLLLHAGLFNSRCGPSYSKSNNNSLAHDPLE